MRYIGSKLNLLPQIDEMVEKHVDGSERTFVDLFAGTNVVGQHFADRYSIISNDILYFSYVIARGTLGIATPPTFAKLHKEGIDDPLTFLTIQSLSASSADFVTREYSPFGEAKRMYFTEENARRIDFIRNTIEQWHQKNLLDENEYFFLLASLINAIPSVSNTTGTYGAYLKTWDKRAFKKLILEAPVSASQRWHDTNKQYNTDAFDLMNISNESDIIYIDTPYNNRQYSTNYHVLETIARWNKPKPHGITGQTDLSTARSDFAMKKRALKAMTRLLDTVASKHVILSYSTDGIIQQTDLESLIENVAIEGSIDSKEFAYRKYKSKIYNNDEVRELIYYFKPKKHVDTKEIIDISSNPVKNTSKEKEHHNNCTGLIKSPLNYIGGKYKLLPQISPLLPDDISTFVDLFSGSATVGVNVKAQRVIFNDINSRIIEMFQYFQRNDVDSIINQIHNNINYYKLSKTNQEGYLQFREAYNQNPNPVDLYTLVSYSFNYQFRFNSAMRYNNPFGRNRSCFSKRMETNLRRFVDKLHNIDATFISIPFHTFDISHLNHHDFVYADPPYLITTGSYNDGTRCFGDWTLDHEQQLHQFLDKLNTLNIRFAMSNVLTHKGKNNNTLKKWIIKRGYKVHHLNYSYTNSSYNTTRENSDEVLITNY